MNVLLKLRRRSLQADVLSNGWKVASLRRGWRFEDDWGAPETKDLIQAYLHALPMGEAVRDLGFARGLQGVGITETIEDLRAFFIAVGGALDSTSQQRLTEGWVAATEATDPVPCVDPLTGLPTVEHFNRVLQDLYEGTGFDPDDYVIGRIALPSFTGGPTRRWAVLAELGLCCQKSFAGSGASIVFLDNTICVLMVASKENYARMISCHTALMNVTYFPWNPEEITYDSLSSLAAKHPNGLGKKNAIVSLTDSI